MSATKARGLRDRASRLLDSIEALEGEALELNGTRHPCACCGMMKCENLDEWQWRQTIEGATSKLRRVAESMKGSAMKLEREGTS